MPGVDALTPGEVREALQLLDPSRAPVPRGAAVRALRELLTVRGTVRGLLDGAPQGARAAFVRLAQDGPASVQELLGRGWWGHGVLPPPLDWLQRRALVVVGADGLVHVCDEAREGFGDVNLTPVSEAAGRAQVRGQLGLTPVSEAAGRAQVRGQPGLTPVREAAGRAQVRGQPDLTPDASAAEPASEGLGVEAAGCVVVAPSAAGLDRALTVTAAGLRAVAPTVAVSKRSARAVAAALRGAGLALADDAVVAAEPTAPALPGTAEDAFGPRAVRALLERALAEGRQVRLQYFASSRGGAATERVVDPWAFGDDLLRGYCHLRSGERAFAVDRIGRARLLPSPVQVPCP